MEIKYNVYNSKIEGVLINAYIKKNTLNKQLNFSSQETTKMWPIFAEELAKNK